MQAKLIFVSPSFDDQKAEKVEHGPDRLFSFASGHQKPRYAGVGREESLQLKERESEPSTRPDEDSRSDKVEGSGIAPPHEHEHRVT